MRRLERSLVRSRCTNVPCGSSPDPVQQFAQDNPAKTAKDDHRPGLPHQSVDELVKLRIGHIHICCEFRASLFAKSDSYGIFSGRRIKPRFAFIPSPEEWARQLFVTILNHHGLR
jgi:hypothetical protein